MYTGDEQLNTQLNLSTQKLTRSSMPNLWKKTRNKGTHYIFRLFLWFICNMCNTVRYYWLIKEINKPAADCFILRHFKLRSIIKTTQWFPKVLIHAAHEKTNKTNMFSLFLTESESKEGCKNSHGHCLFICWLFLLGGAEKWEHFPLITRTNHWLSKHLKINWTVDN